MDISISLDEYVELVNDGVSHEKELTDEERHGLSKRALKHYDLTCGIGCGHCFECNGEVRNPLMTTEEVFKLLKEAKDLGLKHVKFLGPGELMYNQRMFDILDFLRDNNIKIGIFTKGIALGDDAKAQAVFGISAEELCEKIASYKNVTILLSLTSTDKVTEQTRINAANVPELFNIRNRAFENLAKAGLNSDPKQQRLALICAPILNDNIDEIVDIYRWGLERNIPVVAAPTMVSGKGSDMMEINDGEFKEKKLVDLYADIYAMLIRRNIMTLEQIEEEGVSPYPGYVCNQFIDGMLIRKDGMVQACPGNESPDYIYAQDVRKKTLKEIWKSSAGYKIREQLIREGKLKLTQPCYAKTEGTVLPDGSKPIQKNCGSIPEGFYEKVMLGIRERVKEVV